MKKCFLYFIMSALFFSSGCKNESTGNLPELQKIKNTESINQPIFNGELEPTLYTNLTAKQIDSIVAIYSEFENNGYLYAGSCTGTLISPHVVLTAAHCVYDENKEVDADNIYVIIGSDYSQPDKILYVSEVYFKDYLKDFNDDIAILILEEPENTTTKIEIKSGGVSDIIGHEVQSVGYGKTDPEDEYSNNSQRYWVTLDCFGYFSGQLAVIGYGKKGTLQGDSGSPLLYDYGDGVRVAGVLSTGENYAYVSSYTPVDIHEDWIRSFVNEYDNPTCKAACANKECGQSGACFCGNCDYGMECNTATSKCEKKPAGRGGVCISYEAWNALGGTKCITNADCSDGKICYKETMGSVCLTPCKPEPCSASDSSSYCMPVPSNLEGSYNSFCVENNHTECDINGDYWCNSSDDGIGYCVGDEEEKCYKLCTHVDTCAVNEGCMPYDNGCESICAARNCGEIAGCDCGGCEDGAECVNNVCFKEEAQDETTDDEPEQNNNNSQICACDIDTACSSDCPCDPECPCTCDVSKKCDCACDADCRDPNNSKKKGCNAGGETGLGALLALILLFMKKRQFV